MCENWKKKKEHKKELIKVLSWNTQAALLFYAVPKDEVLSAESFYGRKTGYQDGLNLTIFELVFWREYSEAYIIW